MGYVCMCACTGEKTKADNKQRDKQLKTYSVSVFTRSDTSFQVLH